MKQLFLSTILLLLPSWSNAQGCIQSLNEILVGEAAVTDLEQVRTYTLCADTTYAVDRLNAAGGFDNNNPFLFLRSNARVRCTQTGRSSRNCIIDGTGDNGVYILPALLEGRETFADGITITGVTFDRFVEGDQVPALIALTSGKVTFSDCRFLDSTSNFAFFAIIQLVGARRRVLSVAEEEENQRSLEIIRSDETDMDQKKAEASKMAVRMKKKAAELIAHVKERKQKRDRHLMEVTDEEEPQDRTTDAISIEEGEPDEHHRDLQQNNKLIIILEKCEFNGNFLPAEPTTDGGLTLFFASSASLEAINQNVPIDQIDAVDPVAPTLDLRLFNNQFINNLWSFAPGTLAGYSTWVDFGSAGKLRLQNNCWINSDLSALQRSSMALIRPASSFTVNNNHVTPAQNLNCQVLQRIRPTDYEFISCESSVVVNDVGSCNSGDSVPGGGFCFSGEMWVEVEQKGLIQIKDLQLGDHVLTPSGYDRVYSFGHYKPAASAEYLQFLPSRLEMSPNHMVYLKDSDDPVPASNVKKGDMLRNQDQPVSAIRSVTRQGMFAPFTTSGQLIVNGVPVSSYVAFQDLPSMNIGGIQTTISYQWIAHTFQVPHLIYCRYLSACVEETYTDEGISTWVATPWQMATFVTSRSWLFTLLSPFILGFFGMLALLKVLVLQHSPLHLVVAAIVTGVALAAARRMTIRQHGKASWKVRV